MTCLLPVYSLSVFLVFVSSFSNQSSLDWGFFAHRLINRTAVFRLPQPLVHFYRKHIYMITMEAVGPDKRRHILKDEAPMHYIDMDAYPEDLLDKWQNDPMYFDSIPRDQWYTHGALPYQVHRYANRLTHAFMNNNSGLILRLSADLGHYIADAHVPLHTSENYDGQLSGQEGVHGLWESRLPELFADTYDLTGRKAQYIREPALAIWKVISESHLAVDSVLKTEKAETQRRKGHIKAFDTRNQRIVQQYSREFAAAYHKKLNDMVERRMRGAIQLTADIWFTCWVNAGQPDLLPGEVRVSVDSVKSERATHIRNNIHPVD